MRGTMVAGRYRLKEPIGSGGMGTVWRAEDLQENHDTALKIIPVGEGDPVRETAFRREAQVAALLSHPNVVAVRGHGAAGLDGRRILYLAMDLVGGPPLNTLTGRPLPVTQALTWAIQISQALEAAHRRGIVHRDLKPSNILLDETAGQTARLCDFGIARLADTTHHTLTVTGVAIGTPAYMSPEQARGDTTLGAPSDLYSLGCLLHEFLAGSVPFTGTGWQVLNQHLYTAPAPMSALRPGIPRELEQLVLELLDKEPDRRPTAADTRARLTQLHAALAAIADAPTAVPTQRLPTPTLVATVPDTAAQDCSSPRAGRTALYAGAVTAATIAGEVSLTTALPDTWSVALGSAAGLLLAGIYCLDPPRPPVAQELRITTAGLLTMLILTGGAVLATLIAAPSRWEAALTLAFMGGPALVGCATGVRRLVEGALRRRTGWSADLATTAGALHTTTLLLAAHHAGLSVLALVGVGVVVWPAAALLTAVLTPGLAGHGAADSVEGERTAQIGRAPSGRPRSAMTPWPSSRRSFGACVLPATVSSSPPSAYPMDGPRDSMPPAPPPPSFGTRSENTRPRRPLPSR